jgi:hypothetical protein
MLDLPNALVPVTVPDVVVEERSLGRRGNEAGMNSVRNFGVLVDGAADEFDFQHASLRVIANAAEVAR